MFKQTTLEMTRNFTIQQKNRKGIENEINTFSRLYFLINHLHYRLFNYNNFKADNVLHGKTYLNFRFLKTFLHFLNNAARYKKEDETKGQ